SRTLCRHTDARHAHGGQAGQPPAGQLSGRRNAGHAATGQYGRCRAARLLAGARASRSGPVRAGRLRQRCGDPGTDAMAAARAAMVHRPSMDRDRSGVPGPVPRRAKLCTADPHGRAARLAAVVAVRGSGIGSVARRPDIAAATPSRHMVGADRTGSGLHRHHHGVAARILAPPLRPGTEEPALSCGAVGRLRVGGPTVEYLIVKWLHVLSSTLLFGTGIGSAFYLLLSSLSKDATVVAKVSGYVVIADYLFTATTAVAQP